MDAQEFERLMLACAELAQRFPEGLVYIGGIAVYLHALNHPASRELAEFTHDADLYIALADMGDLRDQESLTPNRRLSKHQLILRGFEFDVYTERQSALIVPYADVIAHAQRISDIRVASIEHLLVLKLEAYRDRRHSTRGEKDAKDILRLAAVAAARRQAFRTDLAAPYLSDEHLDLLEAVERGPTAAALARGNAVLAKRFRSQLREIRGALAAAGDDPRAAPAPRG